MKYNINKYFSEIECSKIIEYCNENGVDFKYDSSDYWDCKQINTNSFKKKIIKKFINLHKEKKTNYWFDYDNFNIEYINITLTKYYDGRFLSLHKDQPSVFTTVILLTDNFADGRFVLSETLGKDENDLKNDSIKINLNIGEGISFNGSKIFHGVMPVHTGIRFALNVWMSNEKNKKEKTLI
jgi:predicted 2-oxoglutarate/Fe(II)-dependent dioxygenase YbiX